MRRSLKIAGWTLASLFALVLVLLGALMIIGNTDYGRRLIETTTTRVTDGKVTLTGLAGSFPSHLQLAGLELRDERGTWLTARGISLQWSAWSLLFRHVVVDTLEIDRLSIPRAPLSKPDEDKDDSTPSVPHADLRQLQIHALDLGAELAGSDVSLVVAADAHLRSLQEASAHLTAHRSSGLGTYALRLQFDAQRMDATLQLREPANGPLANILKIPGLGDLSMLATLAGPRTAELINLTLDAGALHGQVRGSANLPARAADLSYSFKAAAMAPAADLAWSKLSLEGEWHGPLTRPVASGRLEIKSLQVPGGTRLGALNADLKSVDGVLSARAVLEQLVIPGPNPDLLRASPLSLEASMRMGDASRPLQLTATHRLFTLRTTAQTAGKRSATLQLQLPDLAPLLAMAQQDVQGSSTIKGNLDYDGKSIKVVADAQSSIRGGSAAWVGLLQGQSQLQVAGEISDRAFAIDKLALDGAALSVAANGNIARSADQKLGARLTVKVSDLARLSSDAAGTMSLNGRLDGSLNDLSLTADVASTVAIRGKPSSSLSAAIAAQGLPHAPRGTVELHGDLDGSPIRLNASMEQVKPGNSFHALIHRADWKSAHAEGEVTGNDDFTQLHGQVAYRMASLADLDRLLDTSLRGSVDGTLALRTDGRQTHAQFQLDAKDAGVGDTLASGRVSGSGTLDALHLAINAKSSALAGKPASVDFTSLLNMSEHTLRVLTADIGMDGRQVKLAAPTTLSFADGLTFTATRLEAEGAAIELEGRVSPTLDLRAALHDVRPALINTFVPDLLVAGKVDGDATVKGSFTQPTGQLHLQAIGLRSGNDLANGLPAVDIHFGAQLMGDTAMVDAQLAAGTSSQVTLSGHAPLSRSGNLDLKLAGKLNLGLLNPLLEPKGRHVDGQLTLDTAIDGAASDPQVRGTIRVAQANFRDYTQGVNLSDINAEIEGTQKTLRIVSLTARAAPGTVSATGTIDILDPGIPVDIKFSANNARPITNSIVTANMDSDIHVTGKAREALKVEGTVRVSRATVSIPSSFPPNVAVLDVRHPGQALPPPADKPLVITLAVRVQAPRQILVRGRGLDAELGGELRIGGTTDIPQVTGGFDLLRGAFDIASSRLNFSSGSVTLNGAGMQHKLDPTLDFTAQASLADATVTAHISGFADAPRISLSSSPDLPQDEILARLLFGVPAAQLTALQVVQIGTALAKLSGSGAGSSLNPLTAIQKTLGLDRLSVSGGSSAGGTNGAAETGATVEAGRYVSSRVFVAVKESTTGSSQVAVDVDLTKRLKLHTQLGNGAATTQGTTPENDPGSSIGLSYTFEY